MFRKFVFSVVAAVCFFQPACADEIRIGMVTGISGPIAETAQDIIKITRAYLESINAQGGINGSRLVLVTKDDQYDPKKTAPLVEAAIATDKVVAIVNSAGTAHTIGLIKSRILNNHRVPLVGVYSGSDALRGPGSEEIFHTRATYGDEVMKIARLASTLGMRRIAVLYQEDAFGEGILQSLHAAEKAFNLQVILKVGYKPGTKEFKEQARAITAVHPQAIFLMGVPDSAYQFMKVYDAPSGAAQIYALSFVTPKFLADAAGEAKARGIGISQVVPNPNSEALPLIKDFKALANGPFGNGIATSPVTLEGYLNIRVVVEAIRMAGPNPTGEKVMHSLASMRNHRISGFPIDFSGTRRSGSSYLDIAVIGRHARLLY
jgi:ABC-type branched-subunit amino acid transport system substrate-binding protein